MALVLTALLLGLAGPLRTSLPAAFPDRIPATPPATARHGSGWVAQKQGGALAPSLQGKPVVVDLYASWCPACRAIEPTLRSLRRQQAGKATFVTFDGSERLR